MAVLGAVWLLLAAAGPLSFLLGEPLAILGTFGAATLVVVAGAAPRLPAGGRASWLVGGALLGAAMWLAFVALAPALRPAPGAAPADPRVWLAAAGFAPVFEELLYREHLLGKLAPRLGAVGAALASSAVFALPHWPQLPLAFGAGLLLCGLRGLSGSVLSCCGAHAGFNIAALAALAGAAPPPAAAPDYGTPAGWLHRSPARADALADAFFVHPTTRLPGGSESGPVLALSVDHQARLFEQCCRVHVPRYRSASPSELVAAGGAARAARQRAYSDLRRAFEQLLAQRPAGRPLLLAGHSQGAYWALQLLEDYASAPVAVAYLAGLPVPHAALGSGTRVCAAPRDSGCVVSWNTAAPGASGALQRRAARALFGLAGRGTPICVNPLSWREDEQPAPRAAHLASVLRAGPGAPRPTSLATGAACRDGLLMVSSREPALLSAAGADGSLHLADYTLFAENVARNALARVRAWHADPDGGCPDVSAPVPHAGSRAGPGSGATLEGLLRWRGHEWRRNGKEKKWIGNARARS